MDLTLTDDLTLRGVWRFAFLDGDTVVRTHEQKNLIVTTGTAPGLNRLLGLSRAVGSGGRAGSARDGSVAAAA